MPMIVELVAAAKELAVHCKRDCIPQYLFWVCENAARKPEDWGFPRSYSSRPNWRAGDLRREVSAVLWRLPTHPASIPSAFMGLPFRTLATIADGCIRSLWPDAPNSRARHEWLAAVACNRRHRGEEWSRWLEYPLAWVTRHCPIGEHVPRDMAVAQWLVAKKLWAEWRRELEVGYDAGGQMVKIKPQDLLDEIWPADLVAGAKTNPDRVFRAVLARKSETELERIARENAPFPQMPWLETDGVVQIRSAAELVKEGERMGHCAGAYSEACRRGSAYILRLARSTAEVRPDGSIYQHRGHNNSEPPQSDKQQLARWRARLKERKA